MTISRESQAIIDYVESARLPHRVTDVNGPGHARRSWHYAEGTGGVGTAVDFAGVTAGVTALTAVQMAAIYNVLLDRADQLAELIHAGPGITVAVHNGRRVDGPSTYATVWAAHRNHVHVAVPKGVFLKPLSHPLGSLSKEASMADDPNVYPAQAPVVAFEVTPSGKGYWIVTADGAVFAFGDAEYHGRVTAPE